MRKKSIRVQESQPKASITISDYQLAAKRSDQIEEPGLTALPFFLLGLFGEVGTLLSALKKKQRDKEAYAGYHEAILEEFGDVLWYFANIATRASLDLRYLAQKTGVGLKDWDKELRYLDNSFDDLEAKNISPSASTSSEFESALISLAGKVGILLREFDAKQFDNNRDLLSGNLIDIWRSLISAAASAGMSVGQAAAFNVSKIRSRWPEEHKYPALFDANFGPREQLRRKLNIEILEEETRNRIQVVQLIDGNQIGNPITDNRQMPDDYRFHDVFHWAYYAILGWSPVLRGLLKKKRKSIPAIDEAEDGARAQAMEEGLSTIIFQHAARLNYFESIHSLDYSLLKLIPTLVRGYEVEKCPLWQWERAILEGFAIFRKLRVYRKGIVVVDVERRKISFKELVK